MEMELIGAIKVRDGLFIGDEYAAQDLEFVVANKVTRIINCAARQVPNHWEPIGVNYLSFYWGDNDSQVLFDSKEETFSQIYQFIQEAEELGESVLVHSVKGQGRCICVVAAFFMKKYSWALFKSLEFLSSRRPDMDIRPSFVHQLANLEGRLEKYGPKTAKWEEYNNPEDLVLRNTFLNAQMGPFVNYEKTESEKEFKVNWADHGSEDKEKLVDILHPSSKNPVEDGFALMRSCIKGGNQAEFRAPLYVSKKVSLAPKARAENLQPKNLDILREYGSSHDALNKLADALHQGINISPEKKPTKIEVIKTRETKSKKKVQPKNFQMDPNTPEKRRSPLKSESRKKTRPNTAQNRPYSPPSSRKTTKSPGSAKKLNRNARQR